MKTTNYNPERRAWRGRSYRKGGTNIQALRNNQEGTQFMTHELTIDNFEEHQDNYDGVCLKCGEITEGGVEPDAEGYECSSCGASTVMGMELALVSGMVG